MILPVVGGLIGRGVDPSPLLREVGIDARRLHDKSARFPDEAIQALWLRAPDYAGDPDFGLFMAKLYTRGLFWLLDELLASADTLDDAFERGRVHLRLLHDAADVRLVPQGPLARLEILPNLAAPIARAQIEFFLGCLVIGTRHLVGRFEHPREVHFRHARPRSTAALEDFFECPLYFSAEVTAVVFPRAWLKLPVVSSPAHPRRVIEQSAKVVLDSLSPLELTTRVRMLIGAEIERGELSLENVARRLAMSTRTLRRRLQEAGTSYSELLDAVRQRFAARYLLDDSASIDEIAQRLGFANPTAFFKAHKRWTGLTPREVRESRDVRLIGARPLDELGEPAPRRTRA